MKHLERHFGRVFVQRGRLGHAIVVIGVHLLHHQQRGGLGQVTVEQFFEFMARVEPGQQGRCEPDPGDEPQQQREQTRLHGFQAKRPLHGAGGWRSMV